MIRRGIRIEHQRGTIDARHRLLQQLKPFAAERGLYIGKTGRAAAGLSKALHKAAAERVGDVHENDWNSVADREHFPSPRRRLHDDEFRTERDDRLRRSVEALAAGLGQLVVDTQILSLGPAKRLQGDFESGDPGFGLGLLGENDPDPPHAVGLLRRGDGRPPRRSGTDKGEEIASSHSLNRA